MEAHIETDTRDGDFWSMTMVLDHIKVTEVLAEDTVGAGIDASEEATHLKNKKEGKKKCNGWRCLLYNVVEDVQSKASKLYTLRPRPATQKPVSTMTLAEQPTKMMRPLTS